MRNSGVWNTNSINPNTSLMSSSSTSRSVGGSNSMTLPQLHSLAARGGGSNRVTRVGASTTWVPNTAFIQTGTENVRIVGLYIAFNYD